MNYFTEDEFDCKCGCGLGYAQMNLGTVIRLKRARYIAGVPFILTSAIRCDAHNEAEGGKQDSSHPKGFGVDIKADTSVSRWHILLGLVKAGFTRIGISKTFIHADDDPDKPNEVVWLY